MTPYAQTTLQVFIFICFVLGIGYLYPKETALVVVLLGAVGGIIGVSMYIAWIIHGVSKDDS